MGTGGGRLFLLAQMEAFRKAGASPLGWWAGRALGTECQARGGRRMPRVPLAPDPGS